MNERAVPLPKFWPGDRVEVMYEINGVTTWVPAEIVDAQWRISHKHVSYFVTADRPKDHFWITDLGVRARESEQGSPGVKEEEWKP